MIANDIEATGLPLPRIAEIRALSPFNLAVKWAEGSRAGQVESIDLSPIINGYKIFRPLRNNEKLFRSAHLVEDGDVVSWGNADLELSAVAIEALAEQSMTPADFIAFLERNDLTQEGAAAILGYSRRQIAYFTSVGPVPRVVALACKGYEAEMHKIGARPARVA